jgi:hypothetical protein
MALERGNNKLPHTKISNLEGLKFQGSIKWKVGQQKNLQIRVLKGYNLSNLNNFPQKDLFRCDKDHIYLFYCFTWNQNVVEKAHYSTQTNIGVTPDL